MHACTSACVGVCVCAHVSVCMDVRLQVCACGCVSLHAWPGRTSAQNAIIDMPICSPSLFRSLCHYILMVPLCQAPLHPSYPAGYIITLCPYDACTGCSLLLYEKSHYQCNLELIML